MGAPIINDVATDLDNPPVWTTIKKGPLPEDFKAAIRDYYKELKPLVLTQTSSTHKHEVFEAALAEAKAGVRWRLTHVDEAAGVIEGIAVTRVLRFRDDFVIRLTEPPVMAATAGQDAASLRVDMRSASRLGKGDLGANANRIQAYMAALTARLGAASQ
ncbi:MAG: hypothetical protein WDW36_001444 [Sanguina aurantia]